MTSLSRLIKSHWANPTIEKQKVISIKMMHLNTDHEQPAVVHYHSQMEEVLASAKKEAERLVEEASIQAHSIHEQVIYEKETWEQEKKAIAEDSKREGYSEGLAEGKNQGYKECQEMLSFAKEVVDSAKEDYQKHIASAEKTILNLGMKVAERIIGQKLIENESVFLSIVKRALKEAREYNEVQLHLNPIHYGFILSQKEDLLTVFPKEVDIYIYPNEDISNQSCIIESANGRIDASIDSQLEEIKRKLMELLESGSE
jgi:flagellar assembly protein FliH